MEERGVHATVKPDSEMVGIAREVAERYRTSRRNYTSEQGFTEAASCAGQNFFDPAKAKTWLRSDGRTSMTSCFPPPGR